METTHLLRNGYVQIPEALRLAQQWEAGQEFVVIATEDGVLLKAKKIFSETSLEDVAGCLAYSGNPKTLEEMEIAIQQGVLSQHDCR